MFWKEKRKLNELETSAKIGVTAFLILAGIGYIFGFVTILLTYSPKDQEPGLSVEDIRIAYYGKRETTALESSIDGSEGKRLCGSGRRFRNRLQLLPLG